MAVIEITVYQTTPSTKPAQRMPKPYLTHTEAIETIPSDDLIAENFGPITVQSTYGTMREIQCCRTTDRGTREWLSVIRIREN